MISLKTRPEVHARIGEAASAKCQKRLNLRGAGTSRLVAGGHYHAGSASDLRDVLVALGSQETRYGVFAIGYSLGGNILLNLLSRLPQHHQLVGAATVSAPIEPLEASKRIMARRNIVYQTLLLRRMKRDVLSPPARLTARERQLVEGLASEFSWGAVTTCLTGGGGIVDIARLAGLYPAGVAKAVPKGQQTYS